MNSFKNIDLTQRKKLSFKGVNLPTPERMIETVIKKVEKPPTDEEPLLEIGLNIQEYEKNRDIIKRIRENRANIKRYEDRMYRARTQCKDLESVFIQASKSVKWEWLKLRYTKEPQGEARLQQLKYFTT